MNSFSDKTPEVAKQVEKELKTKINIIPMPIPQPKDKKQ